MMRFVIDQIGRAIIGMTFITFGYAWGVGAFEVGTLAWALWLIATSIPAAIGTTMIKAAAEDIH